jgi:UDP-glucose 4-epimerase
MTVLITGGAGYIGSHMVWALHDRGERPVVYDDLSTGVAECLPPDVPFIKGDIGDAETLSTTLKEHSITAIAHFAAKIVVPDSVRDPLGYYFNNTSKTRTLLACAVEHGVSQIIFSSTAAVYGNPLTNPVEEDAFPTPVSPYGRSKLMSEWMIQDVGVAHGLRSVVLRYFNVAGADPKGRTGQSTPNATHLIKVACQAALGRRPQLDVFGTDYPTIDGTCVRDYIHVTDLADAHVRGLEYLRKGGTSLTLNCGYGRGASVKQVAETVQRVSGVPFKLNYTTRREGDPAAIVAKADAIRSALGWTPHFDDLKTMITHALAWEQR